MNKIKHLHWRAGFGLSAEEWAERRNWSLSKAVDQLFEEARKAKKYEKERFFKIIGPGLFCFYGDLMFDTDFRQIYATVLNRWLEADAEGILGQQLAPLGFV